MSSSREGGEKIAENKPIRYHHLRINRWKSPRWSSDCRCLTYSTAHCQQVSTEKYTDQPKPAEKMPWNGHKKDNCNEIHVRHYEYSRFPTAGVCVDVSTMTAGVMRYGDGLKCLCIAIRVQWTTSPVDSHFSESHPRAPRLAESDELQVPQIQELFSNMRNGWKGNGHECSVMEPQSPKAIRHQITAKTVGQWLVRNTATVPINSWRQPVQDIQNKTLMKTRENVSC